MAIRDLSTGELRWSDFCDVQRNYKLDDCIIRHPDLLNHWCSWGFPLHSRGDLRLSCASSLNFLIKSPAAFTTNIRNSLWEASFIGHIYVIGFCIGAGQQRAWFKSNVPLAMGWNVTGYALCSASICHWKKCRKLRFMVYCLQQFLTRAVKDDPHYR